MGSIRLVDFRQGDQALDLQFEGIPILAVEARACFTTGGGSVSRNCPAASLQRIEAVTARTSISDSPG